MSIFRNHKTSADRSASDRVRHKSKIRKAIREGVYNIVSDESIIGQDGKKRIKIPVRGIKEFRFVYGDNSDNKKTGSAPGKNIKRGQKIGENKKTRSAPDATKPGNEPGEDLYEVEITLEELSEYLFDSLELPDLEKKNFKNLVGEKLRRKGYRKQGIRPRLSKKETLKNKLRRKQSSIKNRDENDAVDEESFSFHENDLKYRHIDSNPKENSNAVIFFTMDTSGSMSKSKKFMARSFFFLLYHFIRNKYENTDIVFIAHSVEAKEVNEDDFFKKASSGGTLISSGVEKCLDIIEKRYHPDVWNIYMFHCSDGDNWPEDNDKALKLSGTLRDKCQLYCFIQICPTNPSHNDFWTEGGMASKYMPLVNNKFKVVNIIDNSDIWNEFKRIFGGKVNV
ncbi:sporulation protein YhbH [bacterium]|nr:sporulation protein YhbH [bacterium]